MKKFTVLSALLVIFISNLFSQTTGDYRSKQTGAWSTLATWEFFNGVSWISPASAPTASNANIISVRNGHIITINPGVSTDQTTVEIGAELIIVASSYLSVSNGAGDDLIVNGKLTLEAGELTGSGTIVIKGSMEWKAGTVTTSSINVNTGGYFNITGASNKSYRYSGGVIYNSGTITWSEAGSIYGASNSIQNLAGGVFDIRNDAGIYYDYGGGGAITITNSGIIKKTAGEGTCIFSYCILNNTGSVLVENGTLQLNTGGTSTGMFSVSSGKTLNFSGSTYNLDEGALIDGSGSCTLTGGELSARGTTNGAVINSGISFDFSGGTLTGSGKLTVKGTMNWTSTGSLTTISLTIFSGAFLNISGNSNKSFRYSGGTIYNNGTITWTGTGSIYGASNSIRNMNGGVFDIQNNAGFYYDGGGGSNITINNAGIIKKSAGTGITDFSDIINFTNSGELRIETGTFRLGGSFTNFSSNTLNNGKYYISGTFKFQSANILTNNASITLDGASSQILNNTGDVNALSNFTTNGAAGSFALRNNRNISTTAGTFINNGILDIGENIFSGAGNFTHSANATLIIGSLEGISTSGATGNIQNSGTRSFSTTGNYTYNGTSAQITGNGLPAQVKNFSIDNSTVVTLNSGLVVSNILSLSNGNIFTGSNTLTLGTSISAFGTLSRLNGKIVGNFSRWIEAAADDDILFPIGTSSDYRPVNISYTAAPSGGTLTSSFTSSNPGTNGLPLIDGTFAITGIGNNGYWTLTSGNGLTGGIYDIDITADGFTAVTDYSKLHILKRTDSGSPWSVEGNHTAATGSNNVPILHRAGLTSFSDFGVGSEGDNFFYAPENLVVVNLSGSSTLTWNAVSGATSYKVYSSSYPYAAFPDEWTEIAYGITGTAWTDSNATETKKFYVVIAVN